MTQTEVVLALGCSKSTVSRAAASLAVELAARVVEECLSELRVRIEALEKIIASEEVRTAARKTWLEERALMYEAVRLKNDPKLRN